MNYGADRNLVSEGGVVLMRFGREWKNWKDPKGEK